MKSKTSLPNGIDKLICCNGGAGGNRTLVQTWNQYAFYVRSLRLVFEDGQAGTTKPPLIPKSFAQTSGRRQYYSRYTCTAGSISLGKRTIGRCLVPATVAGIKLIYCTSIKQRERSCFRHLNLLMSLFKERGHHRSARLHTASTRCQNRSAPSGSYF